MGPQKSYLTPLSLSFLICKNGVSLLWKLCKMMFGPFSINGSEAGICHYFWLSINFNTLLHLSDPSFSSLPVASVATWPRFRQADTWTQALSQQLEPQRGRMGECVLMLKVVAVIARVGHENNAGSCGGFQSYASGGCTGPALPCSYPF